ncbi:MAG: hypothetical protein HYX80_02560 [Chloroflexi bacterium]|nr:hypothetical protein [Chloroflexota bacterium]
MMKKICQTLFLPFVKSLPKGEYGISESKIPLNPPFSKGDTLKKGSKLAGISLYEREKERDFLG